jgi:hypothetical protein
MFQDEMMEAIKKAALAGRPFSNDGTPSSAFKRKHELPESMQGLDRAAIDKITSDLLGMGSVKACIYRGAAPRWLDVHNGPFDKGLGEIIQGGGPDVGE